MDLLGRFYDFSQQASSFVRSTAGRSATFRRDLLLQLLNPYHIISAVTVLQAAAQLEIAYLILWVLCDEHPSICLSNFSPRLLLAGFVCYSAAIRLAAILLAATS